jgi:hypothetical protein
MGIYLEFENENQRQLFMDIMRRNKPHFKLFRFTYFHDVIHLHIVVDEYFKMKDIEYILEHYKDVKIVFPKQY